MIPDLSGKVALVTAWASAGLARYLAKALNAAESCSPAIRPLMGIVENILERDADADTRVLPFNAGMLKWKKCFPVTLASTRCRSDENTATTGAIKARHYSIKGRWNPSAKAVK